MSKNEMLRSTVTTWCLVKVLSIYIRGYHYNQNVVNSISQKSIQLICFLCV